MATKKFTVLKPVLQGGKLHAKDATLELNEASASTKKLVRNQHIAAVKPLEKPEQPPPPPK